MGRYLMNLISAVPKIDTADFENMLNSNMKVSINYTILQHQFTWYIQLIIGLYWFVPEI